MTIGAAPLSIAEWATAESAVAIRLRSEGEFPQLSGATGWLNSQPLTTGSLRGKVVLLNFWTFSCINSIRVLPYLRAWAAKYKNQGLIVIGVQAPEFDFEKSVENVRWAVRDRMIDYSVAIDNDLAIWRAFNNEYWPALYRRARAYSASSIRRRRIRPVGNGHSRIADRHRSPRHRS